MTRKKHPATRQERLKIDEEKKERIERKSRLRQKLKDELRDQETFNELQEGLTQKYNSIHD